MDQNLISFYWENPSSNRPKVGQIVASKNFLSYFYTNGFLPSAQILGIYLSAEKSMVMFTEWSMAIQHISNSLVPLY